MASSSVKRKYFCTIISVYTLQTPANCILKLKFEINKITIEFCLYSHLVFGLANMSSHSVSAIVRIPFAA